jgi:hypothetical protein
MGLASHNTKIRMNRTSYSNHMLTITLKFVLTIIIREGSLTYKESTLNVLIDPMIRHTHPQNDSPSKYGYQIACSNRNLKRNRQWLERGFLGGLKVDTRDNKTATEL